MRWSNCKENIPEENNKDANHIDLEPVKNDLLNDKRGQKSKREEVQARCKKRNLWENEMSRRWKNEIIENEIKLKRNWSDILLNKK